MQEPAADYYDVYAGSDDMRHRVRRFEGTKEGFLRAKDYSRNYNASLRQAMGITEADLELKIENVDLNDPVQYEKVLTVESYWDNSASVRSAYEIPVVKDTDPMPTDYPHDF